MRVLYPINLDRWKFPVATSLRELTLRNPDIDFYSFSSPTSDEDRLLGQSLLWSQPHIHKIQAADLFLQSFDIIHHASATTRNLLAARIAKARSFGKCVHVFTAPIQPHADDQYYKQFVQSVYQADVLASVSHAVADDIEKLFGRKVDAVIPSGVDLNFFSSDQAEAPDLKKFGIQQPYVLFVGVLTQRKRPDLFIRIASMLPKLDFVMIGGAYTEQEKEYYYSMAAPYPNIKCLGAMPRTMVRDFMASAQAMVFPSELEGLPLTILEGLAMGLPVLAQPKTSMPEAVIDNVTGWLFTEEPIHDWVDKLQEIATWTDSQRQQFATGAHTFIAQNYSWDGIAEQYAELYQKITNLA